MTRLLHFSIGLSLLLLVACTDNKIDPEESTITINFEYVNNSSSLILDQPIYTNAVGQPYSIKTVKHIISKITFHKADGTSYVSPDIHYIDIRDTETLSLELSTKLSYGTYTSISFVHGLAPEDNITGSLGIDIDRLMEWPVPMGGGYHYMKLEGDYLGTMGSSFFNFHSGALSGTDYSIPMEIPISDVSVVGETFKLSIVMDIGKWFENPTDWDFEYWGSGIMGNSDAQATVQKNGNDVFIITFPLENK